MALANMAILLSLFENFGSMFTLYLSAVVNISLTTPAHFLLYVTYPVTLSIFNDKVPCFPVA